MARKKNVYPTKSLILTSVVVITIFLLVAAVKTGVIVLPRAASNSIIWSTGHENGSWNDWLKSQSGAFYPTGNGKIEASKEAAHSGSYSLKHQVTGISNQMVATRIFRWAEHLNEGYYSCWYMFPELPRVSGWLNIFQFKKHDYADQGGTGAIDPTWYNIVTNSGSGSTLQLTHWSRNNGDIKNYTANAGPAPALQAGKWFHIEWYYKDGVSDGQIRIWIDGTERWNMQNVETRGVHPDIQWAPSLYGDRVTPDPLVMYIDDCAISSQRLGPDWAGGTPAPTQSFTPTPQPTNTPTPQSTGTPTPQPTRTPTPSPTRTPTPSPTRTPTPRPSPTPAPLPTSTSTPKPDPTPSSEPLSGLSWEAENGSISRPFIVQGGAIYQRSEESIASGGRAQFTFNITNSGAYVVKARVNAPDDGSDSFFVNIDNDPNNTMVWDIPITKGFETRTLSWRGSDGAKTFSLSEGEHKLVLRGREAYTKIDKIWLEKLNASASYGRGLTGEYFDNRNLTNVVLTRVDSNIDYNWSRRAPLSLVDDNGFSIRWTGFFVAPESGTFTFYVRSDDGARLWVNNQQLVNDWNDHWPREKSGTISLQKGQKYPIKLEYYENRGYASIRLSFSQGSTRKQVIPSEYLLPN